MAIEFPPAQDKLKEHAKRAAALLGIPVCISIILEPQIIAHPAKIIIGNKQPKGRAEGVSIDKANESYDQSLPSGFSKINQEDKEKLANASSARFIDLYGGLPLFRESKKVGAIGISGGTKMEDLAIGYFALIKSNFQTKKEWLQMLKILTEEEKNELEVYLNELGLDRVLTYLNLSD